MNLCTFALTMILGTLALTSHAMTEAERRSLLQQRAFFDQEYDAEEASREAHYRREYGMRF